MIRGIYSAAGGMITDMYRTDAIANDLANVDTTGYKRTVATAREYPFHEYFRIKDNLEQIGMVPINRPASVGSMGTGVMVSNTHVIFEQGRMEKTDDSLDIAIQGKGFFMVAPPTEAGEPVKELFSRDGHLSLDDKGYIVDPSGFRVLGFSKTANVEENKSIYNENGQLSNNLVPLKVEAAGKLEITLEGIVYQGATEIGQIATAKATDASKMRKQGSGHYTNTEKKMTYTSEPTIRQGYLEKSNVNPVKAMVDMISAQRSYEASQKLITSQDETLGKLFTTVD